MLGPKRGFVCSLAFVLSLARLPLDPRPFSLADVTAHSIIVALRPPHALLTHNPNRLQQLQAQLASIRGNDGNRDGRDGMLAQLGAFQQEQEAGHAADMEERMAELLLRQVQGGDGGHRDGGNSGGMGGGDGRHMPSAEAAEAVEMEDKLAQ